MNRAFLDLSVCIRLSSFVRKMRGGVLRRTKAFLPVTIDVPCTESTCLTNSMYQDASDIRHVCSCMSFTIECEGDPSFSSPRHADAQRRL